MNQNRLMAFSSSRVGNSGYLETVLPVIKAFLGERSLQIAFIPFAAIGNEYEEYTSMVRKGLETLPHTIDTVTPANAKALIEKAAVIMVGGGNTFKLLHDIYAFKLLDIIRDKVNSGVPYIGWSAGANITGPTIGTTNDMPVIAPPNFNALGLLPFQINPHYTNAKPPGHNGETRDQRLQEFLLVNPGVPIVGMPEGTALRLDKGVLELIGPVPAILFSREVDDQASTRKEIQPGENCSFLL